MVASPEAGSQVGFLTPCLPLVAGTLKCVERRVDRLVRLEHVTFDRPHRAALAQAPVGRRARREVANAVIALLLPAKP